MVDSEPENGGGTNGYKFNRSLEASAAFQQVRDRLDTLDASVTKGFAALQRRMDESPLPAAIDKLQSNPMIRLGRFGQTLTGKTVTVVGLIGGLAYAARNIADLIHH